jgi:hypothetical protein
MNPLTQIPNQPPGKFRVGDRVRILHGFRGMIAEIFEDRGPIGVRGRRLYGVKFRVDEWNEHTTELPEESLEAVEAEPEAKPGTRSAAAPEDSTSRRSGRARKEP